MNFYERFVRGAVLATTAKTAEMVKLTENSSRDVQIAFANELSMICETENIDTWEKLPKGGLYAKFKLTTSISTTNMNLYDVDQKIVKHAKPEGILETFFEKVGLIFDPSPIHKDENDRKWIL